MMDQYNTVNIHKTYNELIILTSVHDNWAGDRRQLVPIALSNVHNLSLEPVIIFA